MNQANQILGADTDELRRLRQQMQSFSGQLNSVGATVTEHLQSLTWQGRDQQTFLEAWNQEYRPSMIRTADAVAEAGGILEEQAADQDRASGGSGGAGSGGGGAGTGTPGATGAAVVAGAGAGVGAATVGGAGAGAAGTGGTAGAAGTTQVGGLGSLSRQYESNGNPGTVSTGRGDHGGVSYGTYQLSSRTGSADAFVRWLGTEHPEYADRLDGARPGTAAFSQAWRESAAANPTEFGQIQHDYIQASHYEPQRTAVETALPGINLAGRDPVVQDVLWSTAVQHGGRTDDIFTRAVAGRDVTALSDSDLISSIYAERGRGNGTAYFPSSSAAVRAGVVNRFTHEQADALARLGP